MRIRLKSRQQIGMMREAGRLVAEAFAMIREALQPGIRISDLGRLTADFIIRRRAKPLYKGYGGSLTSHPARSVMR